MIGKISRLISLFKKYKLHAIHLIINPLLGKPIWIMVNDRRVWFNFDDATYYHLIHSMDKLKKLVDSIPSGLQGAIIDGGANHGVFSILSSQKFSSAQIFAIEPYDKVVPILKKNVEGTNVTVIEKALTNMDGEIVLYTSPSTDQLGSVIRDNVKDFLTKGEAIIEHRVPAISLKSLVKDHEIEKIAVLKLDVQGAEYSILEAADEVLAITECLILEVMLVEKTAIELLSKAKSFFPYYRVVNQVSYGADIIFSKHPL